MVAPERYQLLGPLGTGGMAEVLLAKARGPNGFERLLAVKRILPERAKDPDAVRMLIDEARNAAGLSHHRIVQVLDVEMRDGAVLYAMEYLHGQTLEAVLAKAGRLSLDTSIAICVAVADGLHHAHERTIVHRDVAPSNVMILYDGNIKLIDFGIAKAANNLSNTVFGTFKGRLGYSSPEQVRCELVDRRTDVYSLGVMLYELTTRRAAFTADDEQQMLDRMEKGHITPPRQIDPQYPPELEAIVMKAVARDRNERYPTAAAMQDDLEAFARRNALNLTDFATSRLMAKLFESELEPWHRARDSGLTLEEHVIQITLKTKPAPVAARADSIDEHTTVPRSLATRRPAKRRRKRNRKAIAIAVVLALFGAAYLFTRWALA
jgi:eukaryotic-like serine/threonine-protein kinase